MEKFKFLKKENRKKLPKTTGVYAFKRGGEIFYIGKANNIRKRVGNHFSQSRHRNNIFIDKVNRVGFVETNSEIDALILEAHLIKGYKPKYNVIWRDDKNFFYAGITKEECPRVFITHQIEEKTTGKKATSRKLNAARYVGPFVEGRAIKKTLILLRKIFPYYSAKKHPQKLCSWCQLDLCPGPNPDEQQYQRNIKNLIRVLEGKSKSVLRSLEKEMRKSSKSQNYERAARLRDQVAALKRVLSHAKVFARIKAKIDNWKQTEKKLKKILDIKKRISRIEAYDISNIQGQKATGSMVTFILGSPNKNFYRRFRIKIASKPNDIAMIKEVLKRRFGHLEWGLPDVILIDGGKAQLNAGIQVKNSKQRTRNIKVISLAKKQNKLYVESHKKPSLLKDMPREIFNLILQLRDEAHRFAITYHKKLRRRGLLN